MTSCGAVRCGGWVRVGRDRARRGVMEWGRVRENGVKRAGEVR